MVRSAVGVGLLGWLAVQVLVGCGDAPSPGGETAGSAGDSGASNEQGGAAGAAGVQRAGASQGGSAGASQGGSAGTPHAGSGGSAPGGNGGQGGTALVDTTPPGELTLKADGSYNIATAFSCVEVSNVEAGATVYYQLTTNGSTPAEPTPGASYMLDPGEKICGISPNGTTKIRLRQVDAAGNEGPVSLHQYSMDTAPPSICGASTTPEGLAYVDAPLHLRLFSEKDGTASVDVSGIGSIRLQDDGAGGDLQANDGSYEADYTIPPGNDLANVTLTGHFTDAAGNPAPDFVFAKELFVDRSATNVAGWLTTDTVWTAAGSPYVLTANSIFDANLSLEPGVVVVFKGSAQLTALRNFTALGTHSQPILMYRANVLLNGTKLLQTFDSGNGAYLAGPKLDYVQMRDGRLAFGNAGFNEAGAYITNSAIGTLSGDTPFFRTYGVYVAHSWIGTIPKPTGLIHARITDSYLDDVSIDGSVGAAELAYNQIRKLEVERWNPSFSLTNCNIAELKLVQPTQASDAAFHQNNLGAADVAPTLRISSGNVAAPQVDASANYWGSETTLQMTALGSNANINAIFDFYDDPTQTRVNYENWLTTPALAGPNWVRDAGTSAVDVCSSSGGGNGGTGGAGGPGGAGGASGGAGGAGGAAGGAGGANGGAGGTSGGAGGAAGGANGGAGGAGGASGGAGGAAGGSAGTQLLGACNNLAGKFCEEVTGPIAQQSSVQSSCGATWQSTCPDAILIGTCTFPHGLASLGLTGVLRYYQGGAASEQQLKEGCETGLAGTWVTN